MDFEVGAWKSSKKTDDLNDKLFGQSLTKPNKSENPLTGALEREDNSNVKKKKKLAKEWPKPKTKEEALALRKSRKNLRRKMKQKLVLYQAKVRESAADVVSGSSTEKEQGLNSKKPKKNKVKNTLPKSAAKASSLKTSKKNLRNKYKHLALEKKADGDAKKTKIAKQSDNDTPQKINTNGTDMKTKHTIFESDSDDDSQVKLRKISDEKSKKSPKKQSDNDTPQKINTNGTDMKAKHMIFQSDSDDDSQVKLRKISDEKSKKSPKKKKKHLEADAETESIRHEISVSFLAREDDSAKSPLDGAKAIMRKLKKKKRQSQDSSYIEADDRRVEVVDMQEQSVSEGFSLKQKHERTLDEKYTLSEPPLKRKKHKRQKEADLVNLSLTSKSSKKDKFNLDRLKILLHKDSNKNPNKDIVRQETAKTSPESDAPISLRNKMINQLNSARFRFINEQLYTSTSEDAVAMMKDDPEAFNVYHEGFQAQVSKWPSNPLSLMITYLEQRPKSLVVADLGCGDGLLAESVKQKVYSFDLVSTKKGIIACDIADVPLKDGAVDVSVLCLSLMGTNLVDFIVEANRITKMGGILLVAEVLSRFEKLSKFIRKMGKLGFTLLSKDESNKMFVWLEFEKTGSHESDRIPKLELAPCSYKKR